MIVRDVIGLMSAAWWAALWQALLAHHGRPFTHRDQLTVTICELWPDMTSRERLCSIGLYQLAKKAGLEGLDPDQATLDSRAWFPLCEQEHPPEALLT